MTDRLTPEALQKTIDLLDSQPTHMPEYVYIFGPEGWGWYSVATGKLVQEKQS